jgi:hypothetical protein
LTAGVDCQRGVQSQELLESGFEESFEESAIREQLIAARRVKSSSDRLC